MSDSDKLKEIATIIDQVRNMDIMIVEGLNRIEDVLDK